MRPLRLLPTVALVATLVVAGGCGGGGSKRALPPDVAAVVGTDTISKAELNELLAETKRRDIAKGATFPKVGTKDYEETRANALDYLIRVSEYEQKLVELKGEPVTKAEVDAKLEAEKKQLFGELPQHFEPELAKAGLTVAEFRQGLRDGLVQDHLFKAVTRSTTVTTAELRQVYEKNKSTYTRPATREVRHILVASKALADRLEQQLRNGADFAALAEKYSKDTASAGLGGKITITQGHSIAEFEQAAFKLKTNEISAPVRSRYGWHIIEAIAPPTVGSATPFGEVESQLRTSVLRTKKQAAWTRFLAETKKEFAKTLRVASS